MKKIKQLCTGYIPYLISVSLFLSLAACSHHIPDAEINSVPVVIEKSANDPREYRYLQLENGLKVLLVQAPDSEVTAVSLAVYAGAYHDAEKFPGLAHYLEHMLFLGTEPYPEPNALQQYLERHAGGANAYTAGDHTSYFFQVPNNHLDGALDRFSHYFKTPLFDREYSDKERTAIHNEWSMGTSQDMRILQQLMGLTANPQHPAARFHVGNKDTLPSGDSGLYEAMLAFYQRYYHANNMALAIVGGGDLDEVEIKARKYFGSIRQGEPAPAQPWPTGLPEAYQGRHIYYQPQTQLRQLIIEFPVANNLSQWRVKPNAYVMDLLSSEEPGTLGHYLRQRQLANSVAASVRVNYYGKDGILRLEIDATEQGMAERNHMIAATLAYLDKLRGEGIARHYFDEQKALAERSFAQNAPPPPMQQAIHATAFMQHFPVQVVNSLGARFDQFDPEAITAVVDQLRPERMRLWHIGNSEPVDSDIPYYDGRYAVQDISVAELKDWQTEASTIELALPGANTLASTGKQSTVDNEVQTFTQLVNEPGLDVWFRHAEHHQNGQGFLHYVWNSHLGMTDARHYVLGCMVNGLLQHQNISLINKARRVGIHIGFDRTDDNMQTLTLVGPAENHGELAQQLIDTLSEFNATDDELDDERDRFSRWIRGEIQDPPAQQLQRWLGWQTQGVAWEREQLLIEAATITTEELHQYYKQLRQISTLRLYAFGHYTPEQVINLSRYAEQGLGSERQPRPFYQQKVHMPEPGQHWRVSREVSHNDVAWMRAYSHPDTSMQARASLLMINQLINNPLFTQLRTEEQWGYIVGAGITMLGDHPALLVLLQSYNKPLPDIEQRIERFMVEFETQLAELDNTELDELRSSVVAQLGQKPNDFTIEAAGRLGDFYLNQGRFDTLERVIEALGDITLEQLINDYRQLVVEREGGVTTLQAKGARFSDTPFAAQASP